MQRANKQLVRPRSRPSPPSKQPPAARRDALIVLAKLSGKSNHLRMEFKLNICAAVLTLTPFAITSACFDESVLRACVRTDAIHSHSHSPRIVYTAALSRRTTSSRLCLPYCFPTGNNRKAGKGENRRAITPGHPVAVCSSVIVKWKCFKQKLFARRRTETVGRRLPRKRQRRFVRCTIVPNRGLVLCT